MPNSLPALFHSDRWGNRWSKEAVLLIFGNASMATAVRLDPRGAADLASRLHSEIAAYESTHGTLWSEDSSANGAISVIRLPIEDHPLLSIEGSFIYRLIKNLPLDGWEQSFKLRAGELLDCRFLAGIAREKLSDQDFDFLAGQMAAPEEFRRSMREQLEASVFIHIGFEQGKQNHTCKLYLEFPLARDGDLASRLPLYRGFKWTPSDPSQRAVSTYTQPRSEAKAALRDSIARSFGPSENAASRAAHQIVALAMDKCPGRTLDLVEVSDSDSARISFDVNLYDTGLRLRELSPVIEELATAFAVEDDYQRVIRSTSDHIAGHLSGGLDRSGKPFLTIYHTSQVPRSRA